MNISGRISLKSGQQLPLVGLGTWQAKTEKTYAAEEIATKMCNAIHYALSVGYRHIDSAYNYNSEEIIGNVLKEWMDSGKITRDEIFITTKLPHFGNRPCDVPKYLNKSLERLKLDYVDLYLCHHPFAFLPDSTGEVPAAADDGTWILDPDTDHVAIWKALEEQVDAGKIKGIGVSNFNISQIDRIIKNARIPPVVLQVEVHASFQQKEMRQYCKKQGIAVIAFSPLGSPGAKAHFMKKYNYSPTKFPDVLGAPEIAELASKYNKVPSQILLRYLVQSGIAVIPKSGEPERIKQNIEIFDFNLSNDEMSKLENMNKGEEGRIFDFLCWRGVENHPEYPFDKKEVCRKCRYRKKQETSS